MENAPQDPTPAELYQGSAWLKNLAPVASMAEEDKTREIKQIKKEINKLKRQIDASEKKATKLFHDSLRHAKRIGDLLNRAKELLPHGQYQKWVQRNFIGGKSTARLYSHLARQQNWKKIAPKLKECDGLTIRKAQLLLKPKSDLDKVRTTIEKLVAKLSAKFADCISQLPIKVLRTLADDTEFNDTILVSAKQRYKELQSTKRKLLKNHEDQSS